MRDASQLRLRVRGIEYADIISATWSRGLEQVADSVQIQWSEKWIPTGKALPFRKHDPAEFIVDGKVVLTGYISAVGPRGYNSDGPRQLESTIMSKAWLAVKGSYTGLARVWRDVGIVQIAKDVFGSFRDSSIGVTTTLADTGEPFSRHGASVGETAWSIVQRALRARGLWALSKPNGDVEIVEAGTRVYGSPLVGPGVPGVPTRILSSSMDDSADDLYSEVIVVGQSGRRADWAGGQAAHGWATAKDPSVEVYVPLVLLETSISRQRDLEYRAKYEIMTRAARARAVRYQVQGAYWDGELLAPNRRLVVQDPLNDVSGALLVVNVSVAFGGGNTVTSLDLMPPEGFLRESPPPTRRVLPRDADGRFTSW